MSVVIVGTDDLALCLLISTSIYIVGLESPERSAIEIAAAATVNVWSSKGRNSAECGRITTTAITG